MGGSRRLLILALLLLPACGFTPVPIPEGVIGYDPSFLATHRFNESVVAHCGAISADRCGVASRWLMSGFGDVGNAPNYP